MLFNSTRFVIFFLGVLLFYYIMPRRIRWVWLLITSYVFYMAWNVKYVALLAGMTAVTYIAGVLIDYVRQGERSETDKNGLNRLFVATAVICNMGLLIYFKYMNMFAGIACEILEKAGVHAEQVYFDILLPVGISFISFQSLGYVIDVYRREIRAEKNPFKYALFVSFFPQLVAGPIERSKNLLTQIQNVHLQKRISYEKFTNGFILMLYGYFQKIFIGDKIAVLVNTVFVKPEDYNSLVLMVAAAGFAVQIYCDFGGYSNIAIGAAQVLGFEMTENFNAPYLATSVRDFWRRWHISLSTWFRDYVYIPLGGNRKGRIRQYLNLMMTFLLSGLWHGAAMHYVAWGGIHGLYQIIGDLGRRALKKCNLKVNTEVFSFRLLQRMITFMLVSVAWVFFRADSITLALDYVQRMFSRPDIGVFFNNTFFTLGLTKNDMTVLIAGVVILLLIDIVRVRKDMRIDVYLCTQNLWFKWFVLLLLIFCIVVFGQYGLHYDVSEFIYFQF